MGSITLNTLRYKNLYKSNEKAFQNPSFGHPENLNFPETRGMKFHFEYT